MDRWSACLAIAFLIYAVVYIFRTSFLVGDTRYFTLADDQMISMRYAENLASGSGLVWNAGGPRVEGYSNFLWVLYMAVFHAVGVPRQWISACVQASGAIFLAINLLVTRRLAEHLTGGATTAGITAAVLTAFYVPLDNWAFQGTEVSVLALMVTVLAYWFVRTGDEAPGWPLWMFAASTTLVRPDAVVVVMALLITVALQRPRGWKRSMAWGCLGLAAFLIAETAFRMWYFGDPLPNTYYLKLTGIPAWMRFSRGVFVTLLFAAQIAPFAVLVWRYGHRRQWSRHQMCLLVIVCTQVAYNVYIGGDAWEWWGGSNRFIAIVMPLVFVMVGTTSVNWFRGSSQFRWLKLAAATAICVCVGNVVAFSMWPTASPLRRLLLIDKPPQTEQDSRAVRAALMLRERTEPTAVIAVSWAGAIPYFSERPAIDLLGKMDRHIAYQRMHVPEGEMRWLGFVPGHLKWDYPYSIGVLKPDVIQVPLWSVPGVSDNARPALEPEYVKMAEGWYIRRDSAKVRDVASCLPRCQNGL